MLRVRIISGLLFSVMLLTLSGCPGFGGKPPTDPNKNTAIKAQDTKDAILRGDDHLADAQQKAEILTPLLDSLGSPGIISTFAVLKADVVDARKDLKEGIDAAVQTQAKAIADQKELTEYRKADPVRRHLEDIATLLFLLAAVCAVVVVVSMLIKPVGVIVDRFTSVEDLILAAIAFSLLGASFGALARWLHTVEFLMISVGAIIAVVGLLVCGYKWYRIKYGAIKPLVQFVDHAVQNGALAWTPEATALANKMQNGLTKRLVDRFQHNGIPDKPAVSSFQNPN